MLELDQILEFYPENLRPFKKNILREYLQYRILEIIYDSKFGQKLFFMGGTAIHIIHGCPRFSEDLDFDNRGLTAAEFSALIDQIKAKLIRYGYQVETGVKLKSAFSGEIKFADILRQTGISGHKQEKFLIKVDCQPQKFNYRPGKKIIDCFDILVRANIVPADILLAQKFFAILNRNRTMGRDFYDAIFLLGKVKPNWEYLLAKAGINDAAALKISLRKKCRTVDFKKLAGDVEPFIFDPDGLKKIRLFPDYIQAKL